MGNFYGRNDSTLWGYKKKHLFEPIDKSQTKGFNDGTHWGLSKIKYRVKDIQEEHRIDVFIGAG